MTNSIDALQFILRWAARVISISCALFWLLIWLDIVACDILFGMICIDWEMALLAFIAAASVFSVILAWQKAGIGGLVMLIWGIGFSIFAAINSEADIAISLLISGGPFFIAGIFFLTSWTLSRSPAIYN